MEYNLSFLSEKFIYVYLNQNYYLQNVYWKFTNF